MKTLQVISAYTAHTGKLSFCQKGVRKKERRRLATCLYSSTCPSDQPASGVIKK